MCGIVGAVSTRDVTPLLVEGLSRLEYRGYDSAGVALITSSGIERCRVKGKVAGLSAALATTPIAGKVGIAHTRWATHGVPSEANAHPHMSNNDIALVHNGIIENYEALRHQLIQEGYVFTSHTDTEVIVHLIHSYWKKNKHLLQAVQKAAQSLHGAYALAVVCTHEPDRLVAIRHGSPLVIGIGDNEYFVASDHLALRSFTQRFMYLLEGDSAELTLGHAQVYDLQHNPVIRDIKTLTLETDSAELGDYAHYMQKEMFDQIEAIRQTLEGRIGTDHVLEGIFGEQAVNIFPKIKHIQITACGTSYHSALVARYWIEEMAHIPCSVEIASELRYRHVVVQPNTLLICISQSGETADTLAALRQSKELPYLASLAICNVPESAMVREADLAFMTRAGTEIGVASTKAFTTQLVSLLLFTLALAGVHRFNSAMEHHLIDALKTLPTLIEKTLALDASIAHLAALFKEKQHTLFLGRGTQFPIALEGALKLKEISYIHAEAYPAGELKHGPLALVDENMPVIILAPSDEHIEKLKSNMEEVRSRGGELIVFTDRTTGITAREGMIVIELPEVNRVLAAIVYTIPLQLLAYHVALVKGTDVDRPRNLAKSVTVE